MVDLNHHSAATLFMISLSLPTILFTMAVDVTLYQLLDLSDTTSSKYLDSAYRWFEQLSYESKRG